MPLYVYEKSVSAPPSPPPPPQAWRFSFHLLPFSASILGLVLILSVVWPVISYEITSRRQPLPLTASGLLTPQVESITNASALASAPVVVGKLDYTKANNWFPTSTSFDQLTDESVEYTISIPKLEIDQAKVVYGSNDLSKHLIQYAETAMPGKLGSPVIFGHSILPQFYNPKNYMAIFSTLPTLKTGDTILVDYDGISYTYVVSDKKEVYPSEISVLEQQYDAKRLKLITCVPPGLKTRRLVVTADLVNR